MNWKVPLADVTIGEEEVAAAAEVLRSGWLTQGARVQAFENAFAQAVGSRHAVAVSNGTAALHLAYRAAGLGPGDEFIVPALTFVATLNAGLYCGARPVLADCHSCDDLNISTEDVARKITPRTRLIVPVAYGGFCPDMTALAALARERGAALVEDASHSPLAEIDGRAIGTFGQAGAFSFFANKNMTTGEGGMIVTNDDEIDAFVRRARSHGMTTVTWDRHRGHAADYDVLDLGHNYRFDETRAAIGIEQLKKLPASNRRRVEMARRLRDAIDALGIDNLDIPFSNPSGKPVHHIFIILLPPGTNRALFREKMAERGVQTSFHYPLLHNFTATRPFFQESGAAPCLPVAEAAVERLVTLPMGPHLTPESIELIADGVRSSIKACR